MTKASKSHICLALRSFKPTMWDCDVVLNSLVSCCLYCSKPTVWDGDCSISSNSAEVSLVPSPPCGIATGTPIFLMHRVELKDRTYHHHSILALNVPNAPFGVENVELKEKGLNF